MDNTPSNAAPNLMQPIIRPVQDGLNSENSKRAYGKALESSLLWYEG